MICDPEKDESNRSFSPVVIQMPMPGVQARHSDKETEDNAPARPFCPLPVNDEYVQLTSIRFYIVLLPAFQSLLRAREFSGSHDRNEFICTTYADEYNQSM